MKISTNIILIISRACLDIWSRFAANGMVLKEVIGGAVVFNFKIDMLACEFLLAVGAVECFVSK